MEADAIVGKNHKGALVTINELLEDWLTYIRTITLDNEKEFASHKEVARINQVGLYFANPYCSCKQGANENLNGLVSRRCSKKINFETPLQMMGKLLFNHEVAFIN